MDQLYELYRKDHRTVVAWVENLPPGETRNRAFHSLVDQIARHDPEVARQWIDEQSDPSNRTEAYVELAESWASADCSDHFPMATIETKLRD